ncbi:hypothetical protein [Paenibacillus sp. TC-CSREp1]|uniref:hypothetical protein n=1 Tax=Paenibacillus sp. TC-CSREp1 TaxID=3410089 RepID=UPI003CF38ADE
MRKWVDVNEGDWFYNDVMEATNMVLEDGEVFVAGINYNKFKEGKPFVYEEIKATSGQASFSLPVLIEPTDDNPLYVFIDGVQTIYKSAEKNDKNVTDIELYTGVKAGQVVSFCSYGEPLLDEKWKRPPVSWTGSLPRAILGAATTYFYDPFSRSHQEYMYAGGQPLRRLSIPSEIWADSMGDAAEVTKIATKAIGYRTDVYCVSPGGSVFLPFNLNGVTCKFNYWTKTSGGAVKFRSEEIKAKSDNPSYNNCFFPNAIIQRGEAFHLINKLRKVFYARFTDMEAPTKGIDQKITAFQGQRVFRLNGNYPYGAKKLKVTVELKNKKDTIPGYTEIDNHTVVFNGPLSEGDEVHFFYEKGVSERFADVGKESAIYYQNKGERVEQTKDSFWKVAVSEMEDETFSNNDPLIMGIPVKKKLDGAAVVTDMGRPVNGTDPEEIWFLGNSAMTRAEAAAFLDRFMKWTIERFK